MIKEIPFEEASKQLLEKLQHGGAFLTVKDDEIVNTLTIGWAQIGYIWRHPVLTVMVRTSRFSKEIIDGGDFFTVSVPGDKNPMTKQLNFFGTKSGRDCDKYAEGGLRLGAPETGDTPIAADCELFFECKKAYTSPIDSGLLGVDINAENYQRGVNKGDFHTFYFGIINKVYVQE